MGYEQVTVAVPGGEIFATRRGSGPAAIFLHGGPGIGAEHIIGLVEELDGLVNGLLPQQRGLYPVHARRPARRRDARRRRDRPARPSSAGRGRG